MKLRELYTTFIFEGPADVVKSLRANYPDPNQIDLINKNYEWIKQTFPKGAEWYMLLVGARLSSDQTKLQQRLGGYAFTSFEQLQQDLAHFSTLDYQPIKEYAFNNKTVKQVFDELTALETKWKKQPSRPVKAQEGDRVLKDYGNGIQWWFVDRGFCSEEGRSGKHCGNVVGKSETDQRILSLRHKMNVVLTFIYLPDGRLGEMKAKGNQKPGEHYHSYVMDLLLGNTGVNVTGIKGAGWGPEFNFSIFDLDDKNLNVIIQTKPSFVSDQIEATPREILKAPDVIKNNPEYQQLAVSQQPAMQYFFVNSKVDNSHEAWERAIADEPSYIIHAPVDIKNYRDRVISQLTDNPTMFLEAPRHLIKDEALVMSVVDTNPYAMKYIPPAGITLKVAHAAVSSDGLTLEYVPEELKTPEIYKAAVSNTGDALKYVLPETVKPSDYIEICKIAVSDTVTVLQYVPKELRTFELLKNLMFINSNVIWDVPPNIFKPNEYLELYKIANSGETGRSLWQIPDTIKTFEICKFAVSDNISNLGAVPWENFKPDECIEIYKAAISNGAPLKVVPTKFRTVELYKIAASKNDLSYLDIPETFFKTDDYFEICKVAVSNNPVSIVNMKPEILKLNDYFKLCKIVVSNIGALINIIPKENLTPSQYAELEKIANKDQ